MQAGNYSSTAYLLFAYQYPFHVEVEEFLPLSHWDKHVGSSSISHKVDECFSKDINPLDIIILDLLQRPVTWLYFYQSTCAFLSFLTTQFNHLVSLVLNGWVSICKLNGGWFECCCIHSQLVMFSCYYCTTKEGTKHRIQSIHTQFNTLLLSMDSLQSKIHVGREFLDSMLCKKLTAFLNVYLLQWSKI